MNNMKEELVKFIAGMKSKNENFHRVQVAAMDFLDMLKDDARLPVVRQIEDEIQFILETKGGFTFDVDFFYLGEQKGGG